MQREPVLWASGPWLGPCEATPLKEVEPKDRSFLIKEIISSVVDKSSNCIRNNSKQSMTNTMMQ